MFTSCNGAGGLYFSNHSKLLAYIYQKLYTKSTDISVLLDDISAIICFVLFVEVLL